jgi:hypothetical protein
MNFEKFKDGIVNDNKKEFICPMCYGDVGVDE